MILTLLILGGLVFLAAVVVAIWIGIFKTEADQKKAEGSADTTLDGLFDGRDDVTVHITMRSLKYETVMLGAKQRGYKLTHQADNQYGPHTLIFEKIAAE